MPGSLLSATRATKMLRQDPCPQRAHGPIEVQMVPRRGYTSWGRCYSGGPGRAGWALSLRRGEEQPNADLAARAKSWRWESIRRMPGTGWGLERVVAAKGRHSLQFNCFHLEKLGNSLIPQGQNIKHSENPIHLKNYGCIVFQSNVHFISTDTLILDNYSILCKHFTVVKMFLHWQIKQCFLSLFYAFVFLSLVLFLKMIMKRISTVRGKCFASTIHVNISKAIINYFYFFLFFWWFFLIIF